MRKRRTGSQIWWWRVLTLLQVERERRRWSSGGNSCLRKYSDTSCCLNPHFALDVSSWGAWWNSIPNSALFTSLIEHVCHPFVFKSCEQSVTVHPVAVHHVPCVWSSHDLCAVSRVWELCASICPSVCVCCLIQFLNSQAERVKWVVSNFSARANSKAGLRGQINQHTHSQICFTPSLRGLQQSDI